jgi:hypothetical protein
MAGFIEARAALIAETGAQMVFLAAAPAAVAELAAGHGQEQSIVSFDQFHVADDEGVIEGERAERSQPSASRKVGVVRIMR